ncbi:MAG: tail fiber domain-containing protein [Bacteroidetes bacterium]|nr:tail fiber domain-containing protein [Bacteroidota bacterium]
MLTNNQSGSQFDLKGIHGFASDNGTSNSHDTKGVFGEGLSSNQYGTAYGVYGYGSNSNLNGGESIGLYGEADNSASSNDEWALYANGNTYALGSSWTGSDKRLKTNIQQISNALDIVRNLEAKTYEFRKDGKFATMHLPNGKNYGFLAQDLEKSFRKQLVKLLYFLRMKNKAQTIEKYKAVNYTALIPILTQAIKEQQAQIEDLKMP